jgi:hypothetical protein
VVQAGLQAIRFLTPALDDGVAVQQQPSTTMIQKQTLVRQSGSDACVYAEEVELGVVSVMVMASAKHPNLAVCVAACR